MVCVSLDALVAECSWGHLEMWVVKSQNWVSLKQMRRNVVNHETVVKFHQEPAPI